MADLDARIRILRIDPCMIGIIGLVETDHKVKQIGRVVANEFSPIRKLLFEIIDGGKVGRE